MYGVFLLVLLAVAVNTQIPHTCSSPEQFQCKEFKRGGPLLVTTSRRLYYDATNKRERRVDEIEVGTVRDYMDELILWNENKQYTLNLKTRVCNVSTPYREWRPRGTYPGENFEYEATIGAAGIPNESVTVLQFSSNTTTGLRYSWVTSPDCIPIQNYHVSNPNEYEQSRAEIYVGEYIYLSRSIKCNAAPGFLIKVYTLCALLLFATAVFAQVPRTCDSPPQWEARERTFDPSRNFMEYRRLYYDATNRRERRFEELEINSTRSLYDELILWNENKEYRVDLRTRKCNVTTPYRPWHPRGTYPGEKFDFEFTVGAVGVPNEYVTILQFSYNTTGDARFSWVSSPDCIPVQNIHITTQYGYEHSDYYDVSVGITDPMVWIPPRECEGL